MKNIRVIIVLIFIAIVLTLGSVMLFKNRGGNNTSTTTTNSVQPDAVFNSVKAYYPQANWGAPTQTTSQTSLGSLAGQEMTGSLTEESAMIPHYEDKEALSEMGYKEDINLSADGPGSSTWGYKREVNGQTQIVTFSYFVEPTNNNPNEPVQFNCPCNATLKVFESNPFKE